MPLPAFVAPSARSGKVILACALSSVCAALIFSPDRAKHAADLDDTPDAQSASLNRPAADRTHRAQPASAASAVEAAPQPVVRSATVKSSFAEAAQRLGLDGHTTALLARAFSGEIDFRRDLKPGNTISLIVDPPEGEQPGPASSTGTPLAVRIATATTSHDLFLYRNLDGKPFYYTKDGASTAPAFTRYPLAYERVSSDFSLRRLHPVTHRCQSHDDQSRYLQGGVNHPTFAGIKIARARTLVLLAKQRLGTRPGQPTALGLRYGRCTPAPRSY